MTGAAMLTKQQERLAKIETDNVSKGREDVIAADDYHPEPQPPLSAPQAQAGKKAYSTAGIQKLIHGDCLYWMKTIRDNAVDLVATDAPYGHEIGGAKWDQIPSVAIWKECYRVLKPGAFLYVMSSARADLTAKMVGNIAAAGFITTFQPFIWAYHRDTIPKGIKMAKAIDQKLGLIERKRKNIHNNLSEKAKKLFPNGSVKKSYSGPKSELSKRYLGAYSGCQPLPAFEMIIVAMKPRKQKTFVEQVLDNGKGITRFGNCYIPMEGREDGRFPSALLSSDGALGENSKFHDIDAWYKKRFLERLPENMRATFPFLFVQKERPLEKNMGLSSLENTHPTAKPLELFSYLLELGSDRGDLILDCFMGSGTTCAAAKMLRRNFIGIEKEENFFKIAQEKVQSVQPVMQEEDEIPYEEAA